MSSSRMKIDNVAKATAAWGEPVPEWVLALAEACNRQTQSAVADILDYAPSTVSQVLSKTYRGDIGRFEQKVRGALLAETVDCPALGAVARDVCIDWQAKPYAATSQFRVSMYRACRENCPHSRIAPDIEE